MSSSPFGGRSLTNRSTHSKTPTMSTQSPTAHPNVPIRRASVSSAVSDDAVPTTNPRDTSELFAERLQAWKHAVVYLEEYITATEKVQKAHAKEYEKVLKTISNPLREGRHFDQSLGGIAGLFENMRSNTQALANSHLETEKNLKGSVLPILERLHKEIKHKSKELATGVVKTAKEVDKARNTTQKHIELLGKQTADFESSGGKISSSEDPYVTQRGVYHRLNKQILEENNSRNDLISVQNNFATFEQHIVEVIQHAVASFNQFIGGQCQQAQSMYADILGTAQRIPTDFEWKGFLARDGGMLIDPNVPGRSLDSVPFPNQNHHATQPLIEGTLERKSRNLLSSGYSTGYYVVTPSKYLHEFKDNDNVRKDPSPELSIYLPDATIGATNGQKFNIKGKDVSKGLGSKLSGTSEFAFKAHTAADAEKWFAAIREAAGSSTSEAYVSSPISPVSPADKKYEASPASPVSPVDKKKEASPTSPVSPVDKKHEASPTAVGAGAATAATSATSEKRVVSGASVPPQYSEGSPGHPAPLQTHFATGGAAVVSPVSSTPTGAATVASPATSTPATTELIDDAATSKKIQAF